MQHGLKTVQQQRFTQFNNIARRMSIEQWIVKRFSQTWKQRIAYVFVVIAATFWVLGFIYSNQNNLAGFQTCLSRNSVGAVSAYLYARAIDSPWKLNKKQPFLKLMFRSIILIVHTFVSSIVQFYIPINLFHVLGFTGPIFTFLTNYLIYGVKATKTQIIAVGCTFAGLVLTINGRLLYSLMNEDYEFASQFTNYKTDSIYVQIIVCVLYLGWTFVWSLALVFTKIQQYNSAEMLFTASALGSIAFGVYFNFDSGITDAHSYYKSLLWVGIPLNVSSYAFTFAFKLVSNAGKASTLLLVVNVLVGYLVSYFRYGESLNVFVVIGTMVISVSVLVVLMAKSQDNAENMNFENNQKQGGLKERQEIQTKRN